MYINNAAIAYNFIFKDKLLPQLAKNHSFTAAIVFKTYTTAITMGGSFNLICAFIKDIFIKNKMYYYMYAINVQFYYVLVQSVKS